MARKKGRPEIPLTPEIVAAVVQAITGGNTRDVAAEYAGVSVGTLYKWLAKARKARKGQFLEFLKAIKKAEADAVVRNVAIIQKAAQKTWQAAAWWLERKYPEDWGNSKADIAMLKKAVAELEKNAATRTPQTSGPTPANPAPG